MVAIGFRAAESLEIVDLALNSHGYRAAILLQHCVFIVETIPRYNHTNRSFLSVPAAEV